MIYTMEAKFGTKFLNIEEQKYFFSSTISDLEDPEWGLKYQSEDPKHPFVPSFINCEVIPERLWWRIPKRVSDVGSRMLSQIPDMFSQVIVTQRLHDLIEEFDPGLHQFFPVEIDHKKSGLRYSNSGQFYFWNLLPLT